MTPLAILNEICTQWAITPDDLKGKSRVAVIVRARKEFAKRMLEENYSLADIAFYLERDYATILYYKHGNRRNPKAKT